MSEEKKVTLDTLMVVGNTVVKGWDDLTPEVKDLLWGTAKSGLNGSLTHLSNNLDKVDLGRYGRIAAPALRLALEWLRGRLAESAGDDAGPDFNVFTAELEKLKSALDVEVKNMKGEEEVSPPESKD